MNARTKAGIIAVVVAVLFGTMWVLVGQGDRTAVPSPTQPVTVTPPPSTTSTPSETPTSTPSESMSEPPASTTATPEEPPSSTEASTTVAPPEVRDTTSASTSCTTTATSGFTPTTFRAYRMGLRVSTSPVGLQDGAAGAPPKNQPYKVAWFNGSPRPGSATGNVVITTHTYSKGQALGNDLYGANILRKTSEGTRAGDIWSLSDGKGNVVCYEITSVTKVAVKDYDPNSNLIYDYTGPEELAMVVCWDKNWGTGQWDSRVVFTGKRV